MSNLKDEKKEIQYYEIIHNIKSVKQHGHNFYSRPYSVT